MIFQICIDVDLVLSVVINDRSLNQITYHNEILDFDISFLNFDRLNLDFDTKCHIHYNEIFGWQSRFQYILFLVSIGNLDVDL